jgi:hypothetical protein
VVIKSLLQRRAEMNLLPLVKYTPEKLFHKETEDSQEELEKEFQDRVELAVEAPIKKRLNS